MYKVLVVMDVEAEHKSMLASLNSGANIQYIPAGLLTADDVEDVDMIVGNLNAQLLKYCRNL